MDVVTYGADARQFFDVHARMDETMLRSERIVSRSAANIVTGLFQAQNSADALANAFLNLEHATVLGLGLAVGVSVGIALFEALKKAKDQADALNDEIRGVIASASGPASYSSLDQLIAKLGSIHEEQRKVQEQANSTFSSLAAAIATYPNLTPMAAVQAQNEERTRRSAELRASELDTLSKMTQKMAENADIEATRLHVSQQTAAIDQLDVEYLEKRAALIRGPGQNLEAVQELDRLHSLQIEKLRTEFDLENKKSQEAIIQARIGDYRLGQLGEQFRYVQNIAAAQTDEQSAGAARLAQLREEVRYTAEIYRNTAGRSVEESLAAQVDYEKALAALKKETVQQEKNLVGAINQVKTAQQSLVMEQAQEDIKSPQEKWTQYWQNQELYEAARARAWQMNIAAPAPPVFGEAYRPFEGTFEQRAAGLAALKDADFSSLASLSGMDFSGLKSLAGLVITIQ